MLPLFRRLAAAANNGAFAKINGTKLPDASSIWQSGEKVGIISKLNPDFIYLELLSSVFYPEFFYPDAIAIW